MDLVAFNPSVGGLISASPPTFLNNIITVSKLDFPNGFVGAPVSFDALSFSYEIASIYEYDAHFMPFIGFVTSEDTDNYYVQTSGCLSTTILDIVNEFDSILYLDNQALRGDKSDYRDNLAVVTVLLNSIGLITNTFYPKQYDMTVQSVTYAPDNNPILTNGLNVKLKDGVKAVVGQGVNNSELTILNDPFKPLTTNTTNYLYLGADGVTAVTTEPHLIVPTEAYNINNRWIKINQQFRTSASSPSAVVGITTYTGSEGINWSQGRVTINGAQTVTPDNYIQEYTLRLARGTPANIQIGIVPETYTPVDAFLGNDVLCFAINTTTNPLSSPTGGNWNRLTASNLGSFVANDDVRIIIDMLAQQVYFGKNNTWFNSGNPMATYITPLRGVRLVPIVATVSDTGTMVQITAINNATVTNYPANIVAQTSSNHTYYAVDSNKSYKVTGGNITYRNQLYIGSITTNTSDVTAVNAVPVANKYSDTVTLTANVAYTIVHNLSVEYPLVKLQPTPANTFISVQRVSKDRLTLLSATMCTVNVEITSK